MSEGKWILIAAAPDLYEALEVIRDLATPGATSCDYIGNELLGEIVEVARAALARARREN